MVVATSLVVDLPVDKVLQKIKIENGLSMDSILGWAGIKIQNKNPAQLLHLENSKINSIQPNLMMQNTPTNFSVD